MKISTKLTVAVLGILFFSGFILSVLTFYIITLTLEKSISASQTDLARQLSQSVDDTIYSAVKELEIVGSGSLVRGVASGKQNATLLVDRFDEVMKDSGFWNSISFINLDGRIVVSSDKSEKGKNIANDPDLWQALAAAGKGQSYTSDVIFSKNEHGEMIVATPVFSSIESKKIIGVLMGRFHWPVVSKVFDTVHDKFVMLFNKDGVLLAINPAEHLHYQSKMGQSDVGKKIEWDNMDLVLSNQVFSEILPGISTEQKALFTFFREQDAQNYPGKQWVTVIELPEDEVYSLAATSVSYIGALAPLITMLFAILILIFLSKSLLRPIRELTEVTRDVINGNLSRRVTVRSKDELGQLGEAFNQMTAELSQSYHDLENKVEDRTKNLSIKNEKLNSTQKAMLNLMEDLNTEKSTIAQEKNKIDAILHSIGDGVFVVDRDRRIIVFNDVAAQISGFKPREALGQDMRKILRFVYEKDNKVNDRFIEEAINTGEIKEMSNHTLLIRKDGTGVPVADSAAPLIYDGKIEGCVVVFRDVTREREIDRMKSEFVSVASHQLRTPLTGIKWLTELISNMKLDKQAREYVDQISASNDRMVHLVNDLLDVSRIETGRKFDIVLQRKDIVPIVTKIIEEQEGSAKKKNIKIECNPDAPKSLMLEVDELKIRQVFENLLSNAVKYSKENTKVSLDCRQEGNDMVFLVKDQGIGIPKKQQSRLFEKFFRADNASTLHVDGTGLGLYIAKAIVEAHGGKMWFESEEGKGSTFYFSIPKKAKLEKEV